MDDGEMLIERVRENRVLHDFSRKKVSCDTTYKFNSWKEIGEKLRFESAVVTELNENINTV